MPRKKWNDVRKNTGFPPFSEHVTHSDFFLRAYEQGLWILLTEPHDEEGQTWLGALNIALWYSVS